MPFQTWHQHCNSKLKSTTRRQTMEKLNELKELIVEKHEDLYDVALRNWGLGTRSVAFIEGVVVALLLVWIL